MSTTLNTNLNTNLNTGLNTNSNTQVNTAKDIKDLLVNGVKVNYEFNGNEMVYTIEGVRGLEISTNGYIIDKDEIKYPKESNDTVYIGARRGYKALNIAYKSLITYLNGYIPKGGLMLKLRDDALGYSPDNIMMVNKFNGKEVSLDTLERVNGVNQTSDKAAHASSLVLPEVLNTEDKAVIDAECLYTKKTSVIEFVTEDFKVFYSLEAAAMHQRNVDVAKEVAQVVLEHQKELYGVAEKAFLRLMDYKTGKPYTHFKEVMDNNTGIAERQSREVVQFKEFKIGQLPHFAYLFSDKSYTQEQANEIVEMLSLAQDVFLNLNGLSKQTA